MESGAVVRLARVGLVVYSLLLAFVLLNPSADVPSTSVSWLAGLASDVGLPAALTTAGRTEFIANAIILMPVPILGSLIWARTTWRDWTAYGFAISSFVELVQALLLPARSATFVDIVANTLGAALGALAVRVLVELRGQRTTGG